MKIIDDIKKTIKTFLFGERVRGERIMDKEPTYRTIVPGNKIREPKWKRRQNRNKK